MRKIFRETWWLGVVRLWCIPARDEQNKMSRSVGYKFPYFQEKNTFNNSSKNTVHEKKMCPAEWVDKIT